MRVRCIVYVSRLANWNIRYINPVFVPFYDNLVHYECGERLGTRGWHNFYLDHALPPSLSPSSFWFRCS
jgi:hypothetical protein